MNSFNVGFDAIRKAMTPLDSAPERDAAPASVTAPHDDVEELRIDDQQPVEQVTQVNESQQIPGPPAPVVLAGASPPPGVLGFTLFTEKVENHGEDAPPLFLRCGSRDVLAVFDGLGGAGSERYDDPGDPGRPVKGAYLASRRVREVLVRELP